MNKPFSDVEAVPNIRVPACLIADPQGFGGRPTGGYLNGDLVLRKGRAVALAPVAASGTARLVLPKLTEPHVHLDKCHTVDRLPHVGGDLRAAIEAQRRDKRNWSAEDLRSRMARGIEELIEAGCGTVRTHVDWGHGPDAAEPPLAWQVLKELSQEYRGRIKLQLAALASLEDLSDEDTGPRIAKHVAEIDGALGAFVLDHDRREAGILAAFHLAERFGTAVDFHVDEGLAPGLDGLPIIARTVIETGFEGPVLCGHVCSLMNLTEGPLREVLDLIRQSGLSIVSLPSTNLYLQGRQDGTPDRRGLTRVRELRETGIPVVVGTDNVRDAFCPVGQHDPRQSLSLAVLAGHLDPPLTRLWPMISTEAQKALGFAPVHVDGARIEDLLICDAVSTSEALSGAAAPLPLTSLFEGIVQ